MLLTPNSGFRLTIPSSQIAGMRKAICKNRNLCPERLRLLVLQKLRSGTLYRAFLRSNVHSTQQFVALRATSHFIGTFGNYSHKR